MNADNLAGPYPPNIVPLTAQPEAQPEAQGAVIAAAEQYASAYDGDNRECIKTDVLNGFFAGYKFGALRPQPEAVQEPVAWVECLDSRGDPEFGFVDGVLSKGDKLYLGPPQPEAFEACAKIAEQIASQYSDGKGHAAERVANAIRLAAAKGKP